MRGGKVGLGWNVLDTGRVGGLHDKDKQGPVGTSPPHANIQNNLIQFSGTYACLSVCERGTDRGKEERKDRH